MVHPFTYRAPRFGFMFPLEMLSGSNVLSGFARNVSQTGLLADFGEPLLAGATGRVRFRVGRCILEFESRVTHTEGFQAGLAFEFSSEQERTLLAALLQVIADQVAHTSPTG